MGNNIEIMKELNQKLIDIWTKDKKEYIDQIFSNNVNYVLNGERIKGDHPLTTHLLSVESAFKDLHYTVHDVFYVEDRVIQRWTGKGVFVNPYKGIQPTHEAFQYAGITMLQIQDNKISDVWIFHNLTEVLGETSMQSLPKTHSSR